MKLVVTGQIERQSKRPGESTFGILNMHVLWRRGVS